MKKELYFAPAIEVVEMAVENGIAASVTGGINNAKYVDNAWDYVEE